ncbi:MAG TPA: aldo/keto reductase, partial [Tenuifilaceae bacterium]|nr:aldo/keto reductase [Tenuifilaceae bacterium]
MVRIALASNLSISRVVHGHWRLSDWNLTPQQLLSLVQGAMEIGVTTFDHADIYGGYTCEQLFGNALALKPELRPQLQIVTKCGIKLMSPKYPERTVKHYDYSYAHIVDSVNASLKNFGTSYIDLLLLHRPAPFINPEEVAKAFSVLGQSGKVLQFGVSNFL